MGEENETLIKSINNNTEISQELKGTLTATKEEITKNNETLQNSIRKNTEELNGLNTNGNTSANTLAQLNEWINQLRINVGETNTNMKDVQPESKNWIEKAWDKVSGWFKQAFENVSTKLGDSSKDGNNTKNVNNDVQVLLSELIEINEHINSLKKEIEQKKPENMEPNQIIESWPKELYSLNDQFLTECDKIDEYLQSRRIELDSFRDILKEDRFSRIQDRDTARKKFLMDINPQKEDLPEIALEKSIEHIAPKTAPIFFAKDIIDKSLSFKEMESSIADAFNKEMTYFVSAFDGRKFNNELDWRGNNIANEDIYSRFMERVGNEEIKELLVINFNAKKAVNELFGDIANSLINAKKQFIEDKEPKGIWDKFFNKDKVVKEAESAYFEQTNIIYNAFKDGLSKIDKHTLLRFKELGDKYQQKTDPEFEVQKDIELENIEKWLDLFQKKKEIIEKKLDDLNTKPTSQELPLEDYPMLADNSGQINSGLPKYSTNFQDINQGVYTDAYEAPLTTDNVGGAKYTPMQPSEEETGETPKEEVIYSITPEGMESRLALRQEENEATNQLEKDNDLVMDEYHTERDDIQTEKEGEIAEKKAEADELDLQAVQAKTQAMMSAYDTLYSGISDLMGESAAQNEAMAAFQKSMTLFNIGLSTAEALSNATKSAKGITAFDYALQVAVAVGTVLSNIARAKKVLTEQKQPKAPQAKALGGYISGAGSGTSDSIPAMLSNGESVLTARATSMFSPILSAFNQLGGGVPFSTSQVSSQVMGEEMLSRAFARAVQQMPSPVVSVEEINTTNQRVQVLENYRSL